MEPRLFWSDNWAPRERVLDERWLLPTAFGPVEYATQGEGHPVLVLHGRDGGCDEGLAAARTLALQGFRLIAPSRFGGREEREAAEVDVWADVLDAMKIHRAPVVAYDEGAAQALGLALRHPDRVSALVLMVSGAWGMRPGHLMAQQSGDAINRSGLPLWVLMRMAPRGMYSLVAVPASLLASLRPDQRGEVDEVVRTVLSASGASRLHTPTLLISGYDDLYGSLPAAPGTASLTLNGLMMGFTTDRQMLLDGGHDVWPSVGAFLRRAGLLQR